jgi:hypothetical protein
MRNGGTIGGVLAALALGAAGWQAQTATSCTPGQGAPLSTPSPVPVSSIAAGQIVREIDDPQTGHRWLLVRDTKHPGGPGLLLLAGAVGPDAEKPLPKEGPSPPVIRSGDRVVVEQNTAVVEARLEAVALGAAAAGAPFKARLKIGGRVVRAVAAGPGRAVLQEETGR